LTFGRCQFVVLTVAGCRHARGQWRRGHQTGQRSSTSDCQL